MKQYENRNTLKAYFSDGALPTAEHFAALIDSMLNMSDEGFRKTPENGEEIYAPVGHNTLLSFYRDQYPDHPLWRLSLSADQDRLQVHAGERAEPLLSLCGPSAAPTDPAPIADDADLHNHRGRLGIGRPEARDTLDVEGVVASSGRRGRHHTELDIPADGGWHPIIKGLEGCQGFEVMAGAGSLPGKAHYGLLHAIALSAYNPAYGLLARWRRKRGIRTTQAWWGKRCDRLELRWAGGSGRASQYQLEIRSGCNFGPGQQIRVQLTRLWFDPHMRDSQPAEKQEPKL